jgi:hypothetical protein
MRIVIMMPVYEAWRMVVAMVFPVLGSLVAMMIVQCLTSSRGAALAADDCDTVESPAELNRNG